MNERTRQKKLRRTKRLIIAGTAVLAVVIISFGTLKFLKYADLVPAGSAATHGKDAADAGLPDVHGTARPHVLGEKITAAAPAEPSDNSLPFSPPTTVPEPTTLLLLAPATLLALRRNRRVG